MHTHAQTENRKKKGDFTPNITFALLLSDEAHFHLSGCMSYQNFRQ